MSNRLQEIKKSLRKLGDKRTAAHSQRYFKTGKGEYGDGDRFLGIRVPALRKLVRENRDLNLRDAQQLLKSSFHEERLLALFILVDKFTKGDETQKNVIYRHYLGSTKHINNWDLVDSSAGHIVGAYLFERDKKPLYELARSDSLWERRISIMATSHFIRYNKFVDTLAISEILLLDKEDLIHKAVGWMLREVGKRDRKVEEKFLRKHYKKMPRTMLRYAIERFSTSKRKAYLNCVI